MQVHFAIDLVFRFRFSLSENGFLFFFFKLFSFLISIHSWFAARVPPNGMVNMENSEDQDRKIVVEFCHLLEKSKQLFNGLRWGWLGVDRNNSSTIKVPNVVHIACGHLAALSFILWAKICKRKLVVRLITETYHNTAIDSGKRISDEHSMCTRNYGSFSSNIDWC